MTHDSFGIAHMDHSLWSIGKIISPGKNEFLTRKVTKEMFGFRHDNNGQVKVTVESHETHT